MRFPNLEETAERLRASLAAEEEIPVGDIRVVASPYRVCPLGAHIDHQGGPVLGMTIDACTLMAFAPLDGGRIRLRSRNYPGAVAFELNAVPDAPGAFWGLYTRAAVLALAEAHRLKTGFVGRLDGMLPGCGLSSSASVLLAYLHGLAAVNGLRIEPWDYVRLTRRAENRYIGLSNGILDQTSIVFGRRDHLLHIDTASESLEALPRAPGPKDFALLVAYSGFSRELTTTGYNNRVAECAEAAGRLSEMAGGPPARRLSEVPAPVLAGGPDRLPPHLARRVRHFVSEVRRVQEGIAAWREGATEAFGRLMTASCKSSIEQYECGSPAIHDLQQIVGATAGVLGSRFSGGGFGGCVVGWVRPESAAGAAREILEAYRAHHPEAEDRAAVFVAESQDGVRFL